MKLSGKRTLILMLSSSLSLRDREELNGPLESLVLKAQTPTGQAPHELVRISQVPDRGAR